MNYGADLLRLVSVATAIFESTSPRLHKHYIFDVTELVFCCYYYCGQSTNILELLSVTARIKERSALHPFGSLALWIFM